MKMFIKWALGGLLLAIIFLIAYYIFQQNGFSIGRKTEVSNLPQISSQEKSPKNSSTTVAEVTLDKQAVSNAEYIFSGSANSKGTIKLINGIYEEKNDQGDIYVEVDTDPTFGDLDSDGIKEVAVILTSNTGGTGQFRDLHILKIIDGKIVDVAQAVAGDRTVINSVSIKGKEVILDVITQGPNDPMCCPETKAEWTYIFSKDSGGLYHLNQQEN